MRARRDARNVRLYCAFLPRSREDSGQYCGAPRMNKYSIPRLLFYSKFFFETNVTLAATNGWMRMSPSR